MGNTLTNAKKVKLLAAAVHDNMNYIKASKSYLSQADMKNKKYGKTYNVTLPDPGKVLQGIVADPSDVTEVEVPIYMDNFNTSFQLDAWEELTDVMSYKDEFLDPKSKLLARVEEKQIVADNVFKSAQAVVSQTADFGVLSDAAAALNELAVAGEVVSFMHPTVMGKISAAGLSNFISGQEAKDLYGRNYLGTYAGADQVQLPVLPVLTTPADMSATIALTYNGSSLAGTENMADPVTKIAPGSGVTLKPGFAYKATGLKVVDPTGLLTDQDYVIIVNKVDGSGNGIIPELRIGIGGAAGQNINSLGFRIGTVTADDGNGNAVIAVGPDVTASFAPNGDGAGNPNAWVPAGTTSLTLTPILTASTTYWVGQVRTDACLAYDSYRFNKLPGSNDETSTVFGTTVKMSEYGNGKTLTRMVRFDAPFAAGIVDHRYSVTVFIEKA